MNHDTIELRHYDSEKHEWVSDGTESVYTIAKSLTPENMAWLLDNYVNRMGNDALGTMVGRELQQSHRTLQRSAIVFCAKVIMALGEQDLKWTDLRNHDAIVFAKKVTELVETIGYGGYV